MAKKEKNIVNNEVPENPAEIKKDFPKFRTEIRLKLAEGFEARIDKMFEVIDKFVGQEKFFTMLMQLPQHFLPKQSEDRLDFDGEIPTLQMIIRKTPECEVNNAEIE
ncbi:MAG: hypothetical protein ABFC34_13895 [Methanobacterium sp.]